MKLTTVIEVADTDSSKFLDRIASSGSMIRAPAADRKAALVSMESGNVESRCRTLFAFDSKRVIDLRFLHLIAGKVRHARSA